MSNGARFVVLPVLFGCLMCLVSRQGQTQDKPTSGSADVSPPRFALLIGVGQYAHLGEGDQLQGSGNDVAAVRHLLISRFGFEEQHITTLVDEQATGDGIRKAFQRLAEDVQALPTASPPAQVYVHFSGHGSQVPDQASGHPDRDELDGLDETLVPYDATMKGGDEDIRDDEINRLVNEVVGQQDGERARMLVVYDCCHSGTGARGIQKTRQLVRKELTANRQADSEVSLASKKLPKGVVFLSACRAREVEPEFQDGSTTYGLLSRFLVEVLSDEQQVSRLSYDLLQKSIVSRYQSDRRVLQPPVPQLEGDRDSLHSTVLGFGADVDRPPYYQVQATSPDKVVLQAGKFHHITPGSLFELYQSPEQIIKGESRAERQESQAWLQVEKVDATTSVARVVKWTNDERSELADGQLPSSFKFGYAVERLRQPGDLGLRLKVVRVQQDGTDGPPLKPTDADMPATLSEQIIKANETDKGSWLTWVQKANAPCDLVLRIDGNYASLFPAIGVAEVLNPQKRAVTNAPTSLRGGWGPIDVRTGNDFTETPLGIRDYLLRITRSRNLISLVSGGTVRNQGDFDIGFQLLDVAYDFERDRVISSKPSTPSADGETTIRNGNAYAFRVKNNQVGGNPVYVTVLSIGPDMGIEVILPYQEDAVKLEAGESRDSDPFVCEPPLGKNQVIVLATRQPTDFGFVSQPALPRTRGVPPTGGARALTDQLFEQTYFQPSKTRGRRPRRSTNDESWYAGIITWRAIP